MKRFRYYVGRFIKEAYHDVIYMVLWLVVLWYGCYNVYRGLNVLIFYDFNRIICGFILIIPFSILVWFGGMVLYGKYRSYRREYNEEV